MAASIEALSTSSTSSTIARFTASASGTGTRTARPSAMVATVSVSTIRAALPSVSDGRRMRVLLFAAAPVSLRWLAKSLSRGHQRDHDVPTAPSNKRRAAIGLSTERS